MSGLELFLALGPSHVGQVVVGLFLYGPLVAIVAEKLLRRKR